MTVNASFGFAMYPSDAKDATKLLRLADQRMYFLKKRPVRAAQIGNGVVASA
jgi:GGDEF domain-containing protein